MTQAIPQSSSDNSSGPPHGGQAFLEETRIGELSAAAQLLLIGTYLIGTREQTYFIQTDADELRVPFVQSVVGAHDTWKAPDKLESLIGLALQDHGAGPDSSDWRPGTPSRPEDQAALWRDVELTRSPLAGIALLGFSLWSPSEIQRVAAATVLHVFTEGAYPAASQVLYSFLQSTDSIAAQVAAAALKSRFEMPPTDTSTKPQAFGCYRFGWPR